MAARSPRAVPPSRLLAPEPTIGYEALPFRGLRARLKHAPAAADQAREKPSPDHRCALILQEFVRSRSRRKIRSVKTLAHSGRLHNTPGSRMPGRAGFRSNRDPLRSEAECGLQLDPPVRRRTGKRSAGQPIWNVEESGA